MRTVFIEMFTRRGPCIHALSNETGATYSGFLPLENTDHKG